ncbi:amino acid ABC transporter permease [Nonomuraea wenchangensis]|uniref:amino acid ABC transporter permease n=1 Tax=Nonomuraea wenchangensis TaxID=568860 RepID=UPI00342695EE
MTTTPHTSSTVAQLPETVARRPQVGQAVSAVALAALLAWGAWLFIDNDKIELSLVGEYLFNENILHGLLNTLLLAVFAELIAIVLGVIIGFGRLSKNAAFSAGSWLYVWLFRSTPVVVQILLWGNLALFFPVLGFGPWQVETNEVLTPFVAGVIALALYEASYLAETVRSGIISVPRAQREAAAALGLSWFQMQRKVILPQALRVMIPPAGNAFLVLLKSTALVVVIAGGDLLTEAQNIASVNLRTIELLLVATIWFLAVTSVANVGQWMLEKRYDRQNRELSRSVFSRLRGRKDGAADMRPATAGDAAKE